MQKNIIFIACLLVIASSTSANFRSRGRNNQRNPTEVNSECMDSQFYSRSSNTCKSCANDQNSNGIVLSHGICACNRGYFWNHLTQICSKCSSSLGCPSAVAIKFRDGLLTCQNGQFYSRFVNDGQCQACSRDANSNGKSASNNKCQCNFNYQWNIKTQACDECPQQGCDAQGKKQLRLSSDQVKDSSLQISHQALTAGTEPLEPIYEQNEENYIQKFSSNLIHQK